MKAGRFRTRVAATVDPEASEAGISSGIFQKAGAVVSRTQGSPFVEAAKVVEIQAKFHSE